MIEGVKPAECLRRATVLVVDDEPSMTRAASRLLHAMGLEALVATMAEHAIEFCRVRGKEIDLVLLDLFLQGSNSLETLRQMRSLHPGIKVILMSGYDKQESADIIGGMRLDGFLLKPFGYAEFENVIRSALALPPKTSRQPATDT